MEATGFPGLFIPRLRPMLLASAVATGILILSYGDIYLVPAVKCVGTLPAGVVSAGMMILINDCVASYPPSVCYRRALSGVVAGRTGQRICHWRFTLRAGPFAMAGGRSARWCY